MNANSGTGITKKKDLEKYFLLVFLFLPVTLTLLHFHLLTSPTSPSLTYFSWPVLPESVSVVSCVKPFSFLLVTPHTHTLTHMHVHMHMSGCTCVFLPVSTVYSVGKSLDHCILTVDLDAP